MGQRIELRAQRLRDLSRALPRAETLLDQPRQRLDLLGERLPRGLIRGTEQRRVVLSDAAGVLRPSLLSRVIAHGRESLGRRTDRLSLRPVEREIARSRDRLDTLARRLGEAGTRRLEDPATRLS